MAASALPFSAIPGLTLKAWVNFTVAGSVVTVRGSMNVTSVVYVSAGNYTVTFTNPMTGTYYQIDAIIDSSSVPFYPGVSVRAVGSARAVTYQSNNNTPTDPLSAYFAFYE